MKRKSVKRITKKIMKNNSIQESKEQKLEVSFLNEERIEIEIIKSNEKNNVDSYDGINELKKGEEFLEHQINDSSRSQTPSDDLYSVISRRGDHSRSRTDVSIEDNDTLSILGEVIETADILVTKSDPVELYSPSPIQTAAPLPSQITLWTQDDLSLWIKTIPNISDTVLDIFQEFEITGSDLESFNHAKLAAMGVETSDTRTIILEAIVGLGIDVPTYPTILTKKLKRKPFFKEDDMKIELPISPTENEEKNSSITNATKAKLSNSEYGPVVAHLRGSTNGSRRSLVSCISQFTISDYYKTPPSPDFQNDEIDQIDELIQNLQPPTTMEQVSERKKEYRPNFLSLFSLPRRKQNRNEDDEDMTDITMNETIDNHDLPTLPIVIPSDESNVISEKSSISKMMTLLTGKKKSSPSFQIDDEYEKPLPSIVQDLDSAIISGWLSIKHGNEMNWSKRYCAVIDSTLHVSVSIEEFIPIFSLKIESPTQVQPSKVKQKNRPYIFQYFISNDVYHFSCANQYEMLQWINVLIRISNSSFEKSRKVSLIPVKRENETNQDGLKDYLLSPQQLLNFTRGMKVFNTKSPENLRNSKECLPGYQGMKKSKYLPERPRNALPGGL